MFSKDMFTLLMSLLMSVFHEHWTQTNYKC